MERRNTIPIFIFRCSPVSHRAFLFLAASKFAGIFREPFARTAQSWPLLFDWFTRFWRERHFVSGPTASRDPADRLEYNRIACQKKVKEHQCRALWVIYTFAGQHPAMDFVPDPGNEAVGGDYPFQEKEQIMATAEEKECGRPSAENSEEDENNLVEEEDDLEGARVSPILEDVICHINDSRSPGNR
jgi:hypothetical protein